MKILTQDTIEKTEELIPRYQLIFSDHSPMMALDQVFEIDENSELKRRIFLIAWKYYFAIQFNLIDLMDEYKVDKTLENIRGVVDECKKQFMKDCYLRLILNKGEITKLKNCWYEKEDWYKKKFKNENAL